uniref:Uncharacterized protein n=1 Tax=Anguilla anguilla TaxID=7936 RepID=A0A0E9SBJ4_ANGAN
MHSSSIKGEKAVEFRACLLCSFHSRVESNRFALRLLFECLWSKVLLLLRGK